MAMSNVKFEEQKGKVRQPAEGGTTPTVVAEQAPGPVAAAPRASHGADAVSHEAVMQRLLDHLEQQHKDEQLLYTHHWLPAGTNARGDALWRDPTWTGKPKLVPQITLPAQGGGSEVIMQSCWPPGDWLYTTTEAVRIQQQRDALPLAEQVALKEQELEALKERLKRQQGR